MYCIKLFLVLVITLILSSDASYIDTLTKCETSDSNCLKGVLQKTLHDVAKTGIPEIGIPPIDPIKFTNLTVSILDIIDLTLIDGHVKGVKDCVVEKLVANFENRKAVIELLCDVTVKGKYKVHATSPKIKELFGGETLHGEGNGKVKIEKMHLKTEYNFNVFKKNGEHYIKCTPDNRKYSYDIRGNMVFAADNLYIGKEEISKLVTAMMNENWKTLLPEYGSPIMNKCLEIAHEFVEKFFEGVPTSKYLIGNFTDEK